MSKFINYVKRTLEERGKIRQQIEMSRVFSLYLQRKIEEKYGEVLSR